MKKKKAHETYGVVMDGKRFEVDEFTVAEVTAICNIIDIMAKTDKFVQQCVYNAEGDDDTEYLCNFLDHWYRKDIEVNEDDIVEMVR